LCFFIRCLLNTCVGRVSHLTSRLRPHDTYAVQPGCWKTHSCSRGTMHLFSICYSAPDREAEYCDECVCVCSSVRDHIFGSPRPIFTKFFVHVTNGSVLLWRRSDKLCTSGFMDDVIFAHKPRLLVVAAQLKRNAQAALGLAINCMR